MKPELGMGSNIMVLHQPGRVAKRLTTQRGQSNGRQQSDVRLNGDYIKFKVIRVEVLYRFSTAPEQKKGISFSKETNMRSRKQLN